jgi:hypothetical protein
MLPIAAILAAAQLISSGVGQVRDRRLAKERAARAKNDLYVQHALDEGGRHGDVSAGRMTWAQHGIDQQEARDEYEINNRPVDYGSLGGLIGGVGGALGGKAAPTPASTGTAPRLSIGSPEDFQPAEGYVSQSRIQAPIVISGPDRGGLRRPEDDDWYGNYA